MRSRKMTERRKQRPLRRSIVAVAAALVTAAVVAGAPAASEAGQASTGGGTLTPLEFQLNWVAGGFNAGFEVALQRGYYKAEGLKVHIIRGNGSTTAAQLVATGRVPIAYADADPGMELIVRGAKMKAVATIYQSNPNAVQSLAGSGITTVADLKGKAVGVPPGSQPAMVPLLLAANGLTKSDVHLVHVAADALVPFLLEHKVEAILGSTDFYGIILAERGVKTITLPFATNGVATVSDSLFANDNFMRTHPSVVKRFVAASLQGWGYAFRHPDEAVADLESTFPNVVDKRTALLQLKATAALACTNGAKWVGKATPEAWANSQKLLSQVGLLPKGIDPHEYYTYEFLPAQMEPCPLQ